MGAECRGSTGGTTTKTPVHETRHANPGMGGVNYRERNNERLDGHAVGGGFELLLEGVGMSLKRPTRFSTSRTSRTLAAISLDEKGFWMK